MSRENKVDRIVLAAFSFFLPIIVLLLAASSAPAAFTASVYDQASDIEQIREVASKGSIFIPEILTYILARRLYPSFILALIAGGRFSSFILHIFFFIRFGIVSLGMFLFFNRSIGLRNISSMALGLSCSLSAVCLASSADPVCLNVMIVMPFALLSADALLRRGGRRNLFIAAGVFSLFASGGFNGIITGIIFILSIFLLFSGFFGKADIKSGLKALSVSVLMELPVLVPVLFSDLPLIDIKEELSGSKVTFTLFDLLSSFMDGVPVTGGDGTGVIVMSSSMLLVVMVILFFLNRNIPSSAKISSAIIFIVLHVSIAWSLMSSVISVYGEVRSSSLMRAEVMIVILFVLAGVSLRNASSLTRNELFGGAFIVLAFIVFSNASSAGEVEKSAFSIRYSIAAVLFWIVSVFVLRSKKEGVLSLMSVIGMIGIAVNTGYCLRISEFSSGLLQTFNGLSGDTGITIDIDRPFPLLESDPEYIVIASDLRPISQELSFPELVNTVSNAMILEDVFTKPDQFTVFASGVEDTGDGMYYSSDTGSSSEILLRAEDLDPLASYYVFSSFEGRNILTETYNGEDIASSFEGSYIRQLRNLSSGVTLRQVGPVTSEHSYFSIWKADDDGLEKMSGKVSSMPGYMASVDIPEGQSGLVTILTSVDYSGNYRVNVSGRTGKINTECFDYAGKLAFAFRCDGGSVIAFRIVSPSAVPVASLIIWVLSLIIVFYNVIKKEQNNGNVSDVKPHD